MVMYQSGDSGYKEHKVFDDDEDYEKDDDEPNTIACMNFLSHRQTAAWQLTSWLTCCLPACLADWPTDWLTDWLTDWQAVADWPTACLPDWFTDWLIDWLTDWLTN